MGSVTFNQAMESQWETYKKKLREAEVETPYSWYTNFETDGVDQLQEQSDTILNSQDALHTLFRIADYREQPYVFLAHNPELQLAEFTSPETLDHRKEHAQLANIPDIDPKAFASVTEPNWAGYLKSSAVNQDGSWSARLGLLFRKIAEYSDGFSLPESPETLFRPEGPGSTGSFFDEFYYTNVFKLPTPTGDGAGSFSKLSDPEFYHDPFKRELKSTSADVVFSFGSPAFETLKPQLSSVKEGYKGSQPPENVSDAHGCLYQWEDADMYVLAMNHFTYPEASWRKGPRRTRLEESLQYLSKQGCI